MWARLCVHCLMIPRNVCFLINVPKSMWNTETVGLRLQTLKLKYFINKAGKLPSCSSFHVLWEVSHSHEAPDFILRSLIQPQSSRVRSHRCNKSGGLYCLSVLSKVDNFSAWIGHLDYLRCLLLKAQQERQHLTMCLTAAFALCSYPWA